MDSINEQQPETNRQNLRGKDAIAKIREIVNQAQTCFFCTGVAAGHVGSARPMNVREIDDEGNLWFLSARDSFKNEELARDHGVTLYFQGSTHSDFLQLNGRASVSTDHERIKNLWQPYLATWFTDGVNDPRITVIKVEPFDGYYWDTKHGMMVAGIKMLIGAMMGQTLDDSIEGTLRVGTPPVGEPAAAPTIVEGVTS